LKKVGAFPLFTQVVSNNQFSIFYIYLTKLV
jgi:hypothetical protein